MSIQISPLLTRPLEKPSRTASREPSIPVIPWCTSRSLRVFQANSWQYSNDWIRPCFSKSLSSRWFARLMALRKETSALPKFSNLCIHRMSCAVTIRDPPILNLWCNYFLSIVSYGVFQSRHFMGLLQGFRLSFCQHFFMRSLFFLGAWER